MTSVSRITAAVALALLAVGTSLDQRASGQAPPQTTPAARAGVPIFEADPTWPPQLPNNWVLAAVSSVTVDRRGHVWLLHRPPTIAADKKDRVAPAVLEFDGSGKFLQAWGGSGEGYEWPDQEHGIFIDTDKNIVWISGNAGTGTGADRQPWRDDDMLLKFTLQGRFVQQIGRRDQSQGNNDTKNLKEPADMLVYRKTNEVFVADGYGNRRVIVLDAESGAFKRMWGAFGNTPLDPPPPPPRGTPAPPRPATTADPGPPQFGVVHAVKVSDDGLVYVADRANGRVQVFTLAGKYVSQVVIQPGGSAATAIALSPDPQQQFLYVADSPGSRIVVVSRKNLEVLGQFKPQGRLGTHHIAIDPQGNLYTAELNAGARKFLFKGLSTAAP